MSHLFVAILHEPNTEVDRALEARFADDERFNRQRHPSERLVQIRCRDIMAVFYQVAGKSAKTKGYQTKSERFEHERYQLQADGYALVDALWMPPAIPSRMTVGLRAHDEMAGRKWLEVHTMDGAIVLATDGADQGSRTERLRLVNGRSQERRIEIELFNPALQRRFGPSGPSPKEEDAFEQMQQILVSPYTGDSALRELFGVDDLDLIEAMHRLDSEGTTLFATGMFASSRSR